MVKHIFDCMKCSKFDWNSAMCSKKDALVENHLLEAQDCDGYDGGEWTHRHKSLLMFLETCMVDFGGAVPGEKINSQEVMWANDWVEHDLIEFIRGDENKHWTRTYAHGRERSPLENEYNYTVKFSETAWNMAHEYRRARSARVVAKKAEGAKKAEA